MNVKESMRRYSESTGGYSLTGRNSWFRFKSGHWGRGGVGVARSYIFPVQQEMLNGYRWTLILKRVSDKVRQLDVLKTSSQCIWSTQIFTVFIDSCVMVIPISHCLSSSSWFQVKRACGQARWADKGDQDGETSAGHHHGDTLASGQQEILSGTITQGHISTGQSQCMPSEVALLLLRCRWKSAELLFSR